MRGTFANIRIRNQMRPASKAATPATCPTAARRCDLRRRRCGYAAEGVPLVIFAGKEYGTGSSRDWAAKGTKLLGVRAVIAESFERIHRSNLIGMGVIPLQYAEGEDAATLGLTGTETITIGDLEGGAAKTVTVTATSDDGTEKKFEAKVRLDTPNEVTYINNGGILQTVLRNLKS